MRGGERGDVRRDERRGKGGEGWRGEERRGENR